MQPAWEPAGRPDGFRATDDGAPVLLVVGTGSLAVSTCLALAEAATGPTRVVVLGRRSAAAEQVCYLARTVAAARGTPADFRPTFAPDGDVPSLLPELLNEIGPAGVFLCASQQSPWEPFSNPSGWTDLLQRTGFGLTLPLHIDLAGRIGRAVTAAAERPWLVNACYPDAVNPVLSALGIGVLCGIGNVAILAATLTAALGLEDERPLRVLAHHAHLHPPAAPADEAQVWVDDAPLAGVSELLRTQRAVERDALNRVTGLTAARLLDALLQQATLDTHAPGPAGLPGGYPVRISDREVTLRLPTGTSVEDAIAFNQRSAAQDGVVVDGTGIRYAARTGNVLAEHFSDWPQTMSTESVEAWGRRLLDLRELLRRTPGRPGSRTGETATTHPRNPDDNDRTSAATD